MVALSSTSDFSSLFKRELMLKLEEILGLDKGFEAFLMRTSAGGSEAVFVSTFTSSFFFS